MADGQRNIKFKFLSDISGLLRGVTVAQASLKSLNGDGSKFSKSLSSSFGSAAKSGLQLASSMSSLAGGVNAVSGLAGFAVAASGALGLVPGAAAVAGAALVTMKLGADGVKKAFEKLTPTLDTLKSKVSASLEKSLAPAVQNLKGVIPQLTGGFERIGTAIGGVGTKFTAMLKQKENVNSLNAILSNSARFVTNVGAALAPLGQAFLDVASVSSNMFTNLTAGAGGAAQGFAAWVHEAKESGKIADWIQGGIDAFKQLFAMLGDIVGIVGDVFKGLSAGAEGAISPLAQVLDTIHGFTSSKEGQAALQAFGTALQTVGGAVSSVLLAALKAVAPIIPPLATAFADLATTVASILVPVIQFLAPVLQNIANFIQQNTSWITPLIIAIGVWAAAQWLLNAAMMANPIGLVIAAVVALIAIVALIITYWEPIKEFFLGIFRAIGDAIGVAVDWIKQGFTEAVDWVKSVWGTITAWFSYLWNGITGKIGEVVGWIKDKWNQGVQGIKDAFSSVGRFIGGIWDGVVGGVKSAINAVIRIINGAIGGVNNITGVVGIPSIPNIPYLAKGGPINGPAIVGEKGPELFVPRGQGTIVPNNQLGGNQSFTLNIDISEQLSMVIQGELDKQGDAILTGIRTGTGGHR